MDDSGLSGFGTFVYELLWRHRGIIKVQQKALHQLLTEEAGFDTSKQNVSNWLRGTQPSTEFMQALFKIFDLSDQEERELYRKFIWESRQP
jgi:hypothetical protein